MLLRRLVSSGSPFETAFGYSRAVVDGDYVFVSGTTGYDYATVSMPEDVADQARNIARTFAAVLAKIARRAACKPSSPAPSYCEPDPAGGGKCARISGPPRASTSSPRCGRR